MKNITIILFVLFVSLTVDAQNTTVDLPEDVKEALKIKDDGKPLEAIAFEEGDATLKVKFLGYTPDKNYTVKIFVNNPITGIQEDHSFPVSEDGSVEGKVPLVHIMDVLFRTPFYNNYILLSPNRETTVYIDLKQMEIEKPKKYFETQYMFFTGANAEINNQMNSPAVNKFHELYRDFDQMMSDIVGMTMAEYKDYNMVKSADFITRIPDLKLTRKAADYLKLAIEYNNMYHLMFGESNLEYAYRKANNNESKGFVKPEKDDDYYSFLKESSINNPISLYNEGFGNMVNSCKYVGRTNDIQFGNIIPEYVLHKLENSESLTDEDKEAIVFLRGEIFDNWKDDRKTATKTSMINTINNILESGKLTEERKKEAEDIIATCDDNRILMSEIMQKNARLVMDLLFVEKAFTTDEYNELYEKNNYPEPDSILQQKADSFREKYEDKIESLQSLYEKQQEINRLAKFVGESKGVLFDLIETQNVSRNFEEYTPLTEEEMAKLSQLSNPFYKQYLLKKNNELIAKLEERKQNAVHRVFNISETATEDAILAEIIKPFEGKVIMIDFWATWCGPCRSAMKQFETSKKNFEGKDVVFVYVTNESSPLNTWENMIPGMAGEHIRMNDAQYDYLKKKYEIRGIPAYLILNKKGEQVYFSVGFEGTDTITRILNNELEK